MSPSFDKIFFLVCQNVNTLIHTSFNVTRHCSMFNKNNKAWKCSCGAVMPRLTVLRCTKCGKSKELGESLLKKRVTGYVHRVHATTLQAGTHVIGVVRRQLERGLQIQKAMRPPVARSPKRRDCYKITFIHFK